MAVNVYTPPQAQGEGRVHSRYEIVADAVLVCYGPDAVYGPAGWWRVEEIPAMQVDPGVSVTAVLRGPGLVDSEGIDGRS